MARPNLSSSSHRSGGNPCSRVVWRLRLLIYGFFLWGQPRLPQERSQHEFPLVYLFSVWRDVARLVPHKHRLGNQGNPKTTRPQRGRAMTISSKCAQEQFTMAYSRLTTAGATREVMSPWKSRTSAACPSYLFAEDATEGDHELTPNIARPVWPAPTSARLHKHVHPARISDLEDTIMTSAAIFLSLLVRLHDHLALATPFAGRRLA